MVAEALYQRWPQADEGALTRARAELVRESALAAIARELELGARLTLGPGEMKSGGHRRDSILADALEAVVAAIYLDAGFETCRARGAAVVRAGDGGAAAAAQGRQGRQDPAAGMAAGAARSRCRCTRCCPRAARTTPSCSASAARWPNPTLTTEGEGSSRRAAEQVAAEAALAHARVRRCLEHDDTGRRSPVA